ncbi:MAG: hypothetical protein CVT74_12350 [Alphaproteobacteria bacterium HGW-Alphaproteobacteria-13]|nr:MAG: hypothetical protein CVT74_12350 [Alphaproteobacteria bacterium HGW-Alphaproteobacteria-13]
MQITIGKYDPASRSVPVTFVGEGPAGDVTHSRRVNAVLTAAGKYDRKATAARVEEVARGVAAKIAAGVITNPPADSDDDADVPW